MSKHLEKRAEAAAQFVLYVVCGIAIAIIIADLFIWRP